MKRILLAIISIIILAGLGWVVSGQLKSSSATTEHTTQKISDKGGETASATTPFTGTEYSLVLTKNGWKPSEISIRVGDRVTFSTDASYNKLFWPASNLHPTHLLYPEFDPKRPIKPGDTWSFIFKKIGVWRLHDHLAPYFTGTITVHE